MKIISDPNAFMCGIYVVKFDSNIEAQNFIEQYNNCPIWPIVTQGTKENEVFILAIELKNQLHGDFSQEENTLMKNPDYLGAREVNFKRNDSLMKLFNEYSLKTGYSKVIPCGSNCEKCISFKNPCQGCPAYYKYD